MICQILFSGENKKNIISLSSAENAQRMVKVNILAEKKYEQVYFTTIDVSKNLLNEWQTL